MSKWQKRRTGEGKAWLVPIRLIEEKNYNMTLSGLGLIEPNKVEHAEPDEILEAAEIKAEKLLTLVKEMRELLIEGNGNRAV